MRAAGARAAAFRRTRSTTLLYCRSPQGVRVLPLGVGRKCGHTLCDEGTSCVCTAELFEVTCVLQQDVLSQRIGVVSGVVARVLQTRVSAVCIDMPSAHVSLELVGELRLVSARAVHASMHAVESHVRAFEMNILNMVSQGVHTFRYLRAPVVPARMQ